MKMKTEKFIAILIAALLALAGTSATAQSDNPRVWLDTELGNILLELDRERAPGTVDNFLAHVNSGFYDGVVFHRVIDGFVIQGGGFDDEFRFKQPPFPAIQSESDNGLSNQPGTIAMALAGGNPNSAQSQFFISTGDNSFLDEDFTVFGHVIAGMNTVEAISSVRTAIAFPGANPNNQNNDVPLRLPVIRRAAEVAPGRFPLMPLHTGSWFNPTLAGLGFNLEITNDASTEAGPIIIIYWYDFREGQQMWLTSNAAIEFGDHEVTLQLLTTDGFNGDFLSPPPGEDFEFLGEITVRFNDCTSGQFSYDLPILGTGEINVVRLSTPIDATCEGLEF